MKANLKRTELAVELERAVLVGVKSDGARGKESLEELRQLAETAQARVVGELTQKRRLPDGATYLGSGKVEELTALCNSTDADVVIMDVDLAAAQVRNLEEITDRKVIDRTELILDIFARGARTAMAYDQVELAQLEYTFPRLKHMWTHLERVEGGIGMRGPGERQIETDRRLVRKRIQDLKERIEKNVKRRAQEVGARSDQSTACLVGYTNAGKSTLMNALTDAGVYADDKLFATLDTRTRACELGDGRKVLLSDTVGFIRDLPHHLVASFRATLEEARHADLLLHVVDTSSPYAEAQMEAVKSVLEELGIARHAIMHVFNKMDRHEAEAQLPLLRRKHGEGIAVSAMSGRGLDLLRDQIRTSLDESAVTAVIEAPHSSGKLQAFLSEHGEVLERDYADDVVRIKVRIAPRHLDAIRRLGGAVRRKKSHSAS